MGRSCTNATLVGVTEDPRGLAGAWRRFQRHGFPAPSPELAPFVDHFWAVDWDYDEPYRQVIAPLPRVHLTFRDDEPPQVSGVATAHVVKELHGVGRVVGVAFRPGGFRPFLGSSVSALTDRTVPARDVPGLPPHPTGRTVADVERWLQTAVPEPDPTARWVAEVVADVAADPALTRVDALAARCGTSVRGLQRVFAEYVGVGPKWVIRRYRLREVTERMAEGPVAPGTWADVAAELGYADQAHLTRDFRAIFGEPPTRWARRY